MFMNERKSGTDHVTAATAALANEARAGSGALVFDSGNKFALTVTAATGEVHVSSGVMSWCGRMSGIKNSETASYSPPDSETLFKKVVVCAQYNKSTTDGTENIELVVISSDVVASESAAAALTIDTGSADISEATETANLQLWSFVANSKTATVPVKLFTECPSLNKLQETLSEFQKKIETEEEKVGNLSNTVATFKKGLVLIASGLTGSNYSGDDIRTDYVALLLKFSNNETMVIPSTAGTYTKKFYKIESAGTLTSASKVTEGIRNLILTTDQTITLNYGSTTNADVCAHVTAIYGIR